MDCKIILGVFCFGLLVFGCAGILIKSFLIVTNWYHDFWTPGEEAKIVPCSDCGKNTKCDIRDGEGYCSCLPGWTGDALVACDVVWVCSYLLPIGISSNFIKFLVINVPVVQKIPFALKINAQIHAIQFVEWMLFAKLWKGVQFVLVHMDGSEIRSWSAQLQQLNKFTKSWIEDWIIKFSIK